MCLFVFFPAGTLWPGLICPPPPTRCAWPLLQTVCFRTAMTHITVANPVWIQLHAADVTAIFINVYSLSSPESNLGIRRPAESSQLLLQGCKERVYSNTTVAFLIALHEIPLHCEYNMTGRELTFDWSSDFTSSNFNMQPSQLSHAFTIYRRNVKVKKLNVPAPSMIIHLMVGRWSVQTCPLSVLHLWS